MKLKNTVQQNSPSILLALGLGGFVGSVILAAKAAPIARDILEEKFEDDSESTLIDKGRAVAPVYAPVVGLMLASAGAILASNRIMRQRYAALLVLYSFTEQVAERWKESAQKEVSAKSFQKIKERVSGSDEPIPDEIDTTRTVFYDKYSDRWFPTDSVETVRKVMNDINEQMYREDFVPINDFYHGLGLGSIEYGENVGWHIEDGSVNIELVPIIEEDKAYISIVFSLRPRDYKRGI